MITLANLTFHGLVVPEHCTVPMSHIGTFPCGWPSPMIVRKTSYAKKLNSCRLTYQV